MPVCIEMAKLTKRYGSTLAVDALTLEVETGEVLGLLGPNGAGKSTTLYMLAGLVRPTSGSVSVFGKDLRRNLLEILSKTGVLVERPAFYDYLSARDNLLLCARLARQDVTVDRVLDRVGLLRSSGQKVGTFSTGMRQRLGLAQAILLEPGLLLLDEPATGLDPEATQQLMHLLRRLADEAKVTIVYSSHMLHEVEGLCDRVAIIDEGKLIACEKTDTLLSYDQSRVDVLVDAPEAAAKRLEAEEWVESATVGPGRVAVILREPNAQRLTAFVVGLGYRVSGVIPRRRTLQDYFLKVLNQ